MAIEYAGSRRAGVRPRPGETAEIRAVARGLDWTLLAAVGALVGYGLVVIGGITRDSIPGDPNYYAARQGIYAALGTLGLVVAILVDPDVYRRYRRHVYAGSIVLLLLVLLPIGTEVRGSQRWISLGAASFQPSEFVKVSLVLAVGGFLADRARRLGELRIVFAAVGLVFAPTFLVFVQPDIGTALVYGAALAAMLFVAGVRWLHLALLGSLVALVATSVVWLLPSVGVQVLEDYQAKRLTAFLNPEEDPRGASYNVAQSKTAIGSGGLRGRGVEGATQTKLEYLPERATDFAFASLAEQRGFVGASILLLLYLLVVWRGLRIITLARDPFCAIVAGGIVLGFLFQIFVNVGMTMGIAPVTGIPLPFVSVGGSSMIANLVAMGILEAIHARSRAGLRGA